MIAAFGLAGLSGCGETRSPAMASAPAVLPTDATEPSASSQVDRAADASTEPAAVQTEPAVAESRSGPPLRTADISFDDIKFEMLKSEPFQRSMLSDKIEALDGRPIRIRGFMLPSYQPTLTQFVLVRDNLSCCFGPGAALYDCIVVDMQPGKSADYSTAPVTVEGTFAIRELLDADGKALAIYHLDGETVR